MHTILRCAVLSTAVVVGLSAQENPGVAETAVTTPAQPLRQERVSPQRQGDIHMARKEYREAIDSYKEALASMPVLWNKIGIGYHQLGQLDLAKKHYEEAIKLDSKYSEAINNLGTIYYARRDYKRAEKEYRKALKLAPMSASVYSNLGTALFARKKYDDAESAYRKAMEIDPEVFERRGMGGSILQERSVEERARYHYFLAKIYAKSGSHERALFYMRMSLEEGFPERQRYMEEPEFAKLKELPEFQEILARQPRIL
jgi:tetratricopeptide (TPR) repeat protein